MKDRNRMERMDIRDYVKGHRLIFDGAMGTYYSAKMNQPGLLSELANLNAPEMIEEIHLEYLRAGACVLRTNTFAANRRILGVEQPEQELLVRTAYQLAKGAADKYRQEETEINVWIAGNIGPIGEDANSEEADILKEYQFLCDIFLEEGVDSIHFETFPSLKYIDKLIPYIRSKDEKVFILISFSINKNGYTMDGISGSRLIAGVSGLKGVDACGLNCGIGSGHMWQIIKKMTLPDNRFIYIAPNAGYPETIQNRMVFLDNEAYFVKNMKQIADLGVEILGGCCGTTPDYIRSMKNSLNQEITPRSNPAKEAVSETGNQQVRPNEFYSLFRPGKKVIAVELDPPYDANIDKIIECAHVLKGSGADIITMADSPMGRSRVDSILMSIKIAEESGLKVMPHVCCRDRNMISMRASLLGAYIHGIRNFLFVTGDPVPGSSRASTSGVFDYNSIRLMEYVKELNIEHFPQEPLCYGGALNYARGSLETVIRRMRQKIDAGAGYFLTQPIYSEEDARRLREIRKTVDTKILCGIMPLVSYRNAGFVKNEITGIYVPDEVMERYHPDMSKEDAEAVGVELAREIMEMTEDFADGYYFMLPFNRVSLINKIGI